MTHKNTLTNTMAASLGQVLKKILFCLLLTAGGAAAWAKPAETENGLKVGYVSLNEAAVKTGEQRKMRRTMEKERARIEQLIQKKSKKFQKTAEKIKAESALLSDSEKAKQYAQIQQMQVSMEQFIKQKDLEFQKKDASLRNNFVKRIKQVIAKIAAQKKLSVVRNKDGALWAAPQFDLTNAVVRAYKKKHK